MGEQGNAGLAAAVAGGYLLGRTKKAQVAITAAAVLLGRGFHPRNLVAGGLRRIGGGHDGSQEESSGAPSDRGRAGGPVRHMASAVANRPVTALTEALRERTSALSGERQDGEGAEDEAEDEGEDTAEDAEDTAEEEAEEAEDEEDEDAEAPRGRSRTGRAASAKPPARKTGAAKRSTGSAGSTGPAKSAKKATAARGTTPARTAPKRTAAKGTTKRTTPKKNQPNRTSAAARSGRER